MNEKLTTELILEVPFYDLDPMNVVWHGNYIKYFEKTRCKLLEQFNFGYVEMRDSGYMWPVVDLRVRYVNSATFGQKIRCTATIVEYENRLKINYEIRCIDTGKRLTKGHTTQVAVDLNNLEMQLVSPKVLLRRLGVEDV